VKRALEKGATIINREIVEQAIDERRYRSNLMEEKDNSDIISGNASPLIFLFQAKR
jgi:hypothetical protein